MTEVLRVANRSGFFGDRLSAAREIATDGSAVITRHPGTGGAVTVGTVTAQRLHEIDGPRCANPDNATLGLCARDDATCAWLAGRLTEENLRALVPSGAGELRR